MLTAEKSESEIVIRRLYQITNDYQGGFEQQIQHLLKMGLERLNLDIAILSRIEGTNYRVDYCVVPEGAALKVGDEFDFVATYCAITVEESRPIFIENMGQDDKYASHPAYKAFGLESYAGIPIQVDGMLYGTLNFSSATPYPRQFRDIDVDVLHLMASWIETELTRRQQEMRLQQMNERLQFQAFNDPLTHMPNRRNLFRTLNAKVDTKVLDGSRGALAVLDIDDFKLVNDTYGHQVGDQVLKKVADKIKRIMTPTDFAARVGGEEFVLWLPDKSEMELEQQMQQLMKDVSAIELNHQPITVSIGLCVFDVLPNKIGASKSVLDDLISVADGYLYRAKSNGKNRTIMDKYQPSHFADGLLTSADVYVAKSREGKANS